MPDDATPAAIAIDGLRVAYPTASGPRTVLDVPAWSLPAGASCVLTGASGSGKSTLLHVLGGLLVPDAGRVAIDGADLGGMDERARDRWRAERIGIVFQQLNLLPGLDAEANVLLGDAFAPHPAPAARACELLAAVGLADRARQRPAQMSLGEQQRVAIARALIKRPRLLLADEPTGSLDPENAARVADLLRDACAERGCTLLLVTHQPEIAARFPRRTTMVDLARGTPP